MKKLLLLHLFLSIVFCAKAQHHQLKISLAGAVNTPKTLQAKAFLIAYTITKKTIVDTVSLKNNVFEFILNDTLPQGLYQLMLYTNKQDASGKTYQPSFDVIFDKQDVILSINIDKAANSPEAITVAVSDANKSYYEFLQRNYLYQQKLKVLQALGQQYPQTNVNTLAKTDPFYASMQQQQQLLEQQQQTFYKSYLAKNTLPTIANSYIQVQLPPSKQQSAPAPPNLSSGAIKNSPFVTQLIWNYLYYYKLDSLNSQAQQLQLIKGLEKLMPNLLADKNCAKQLIEYFTQQFDKIGMTDVVLYLNERYIASQSCESPQQLNALQQKINNLKQLQIGQVAPNMVMDSLQPTNDLYHIISPYTLLVFWESNCSHCKQLMPELKKIYNEQVTKKLEVLAVSLDENKTDYINYVVKNNLSWINYTDLKGWNSPIIKQYAITGTPTMLLLDKDKKIVAKPLTVTELLSNIK